MTLRLFLLLAVFCWSSIASADVVKPALVEISVYTEGHVDIEIRASIEALLTGINGQFKNTQDAPNAADYDALRVLKPELLRLEYLKFEQEFVDSLRLRLDGEVVPLSVLQVTIPEPGYTKVPRISVIKLTSSLSRDAKQLDWYYPAAFGDNAVRVKQVNVEQEKWHWSDWQWIRTDKPSETFSLSEIFTKRPITSVIADYIAAGFEHILPYGLDHVLFIVGLYLLSVAWRPLLWQVTMFTIAHTITLGLAMNGIINLPAYIVEPLIALSIAYIAIENIWSKTLHKSRLIIVFAFGLLHGLGFASMLADFGMPEDAFTTALISFNVGVELGQLTVIAMAFVLTGLWFRNKQWYRAVIVVPVSVVIGLMGIYWAWMRFDLASLGYLAETLPS